MHKIIIAWREKSADETGTKRHAHIKANAAKTSSAPHQLFHATPQILNCFLLLLVSCFSFFFAQSPLVALKVVNITVLTVVVFHVVIALLSLRVADRQTGRLKLAGMQAA